MRTDGSTGISRRDAFKSMLLLGGAATAVAAAGVEADTGALFVVPPFVQYIGPTEAAILCETREPARVVVEFGPTAALGAKARHTVHGLQLAPGVTRHRISLTGLVPGQPVHYRVVAEPFAPYKTYGAKYGPAQKTDTVSFRLPAPTDDRVGVYLFNDIHDRVERVQEGLKVLDDRRVDFAVGVGDIVNDPISEEHTRRIVGGVNRFAGAATRPVIYQRGNHETRGEYAVHMPGHVAWPQGEAYFAFTAGPVRFVLLDTGEDKEDDHWAYAGLADFFAHRERESAWLKQEVASDAFRTARWRVVLLHIPYYFEKTQEPSSVNDHIRRTLLEPLRDAKVDFAFSGHTHKWRMIGAGEFADHDFPAAIGGGPAREIATAAHLEADGEKLRFAMWNMDGKELARLELPRT